ncbi:MAG: heavy-metal-associated domain-containing protein [Muribaculaceae bacterium]|nr:heavy-metal-associated domain-containing protein [Muribaculaceae bacterium]
MKKLLICMFMALGSMTIYAKDIKEYVVTTNPQMSCQNCENKIKGNLRFEKGVKKVETDLKAQTVTVTYDADKTDEAKLAEAFGKLNYEVKKVGDPAASVKKCTKSECDGKSESFCKNK